jgi:hypothetical protein
MPEQLFIFLILHRSTVRASDFLSEERLRSDSANRHINEPEIGASSSMLQAAQALRHTQNDADRFDPRHARPENNRSYDKAAHECP